jgi:hypothetical protein
MSNLKLPDNEKIYTKQESMVIFNQLGVKVKLEGVSNEAYFKWLDRMYVEIPQAVPGGEIAEKLDARQEPTLNTAIYYDTDDFQLLNTGSLLRTSCNKITHAFCAFKLAADKHGIRRDHRHVFAGEEKRTIQQAPDSPEAVKVVHRLLANTQQVDNPGKYLLESYGIRGEQLFPVVRVDNYRYSFYTWLNKQDALRCSLDHARLTNLRGEGTKEGEFREVELSIYPRISLEVANDERVVELIKYLETSLHEKLAAHTTAAIKYQRAVQVLEIHPGMESIS